MMFEEIVKNATIFSVKKIIKNSMNSYLHVKDYQEEVVRDFDKKKNYLLYMHIPFCHTFCPFCSFHKYKYDEERAKSYFKYLRQELRKVYNEGFHFDSLYIGGGTTLINEKELIHTISLAKELFDIKEVSCESDPNHIAPSSLKQFSNLIDRLSIGVQSFDDEILKKVARFEKFGSGEVIEEKIKAMVDLIPNTNIDLIFNFPNQSEELLVKDLKIAQTLGVSQITTYPLMNSELTRTSMNNAFGEQSNTKEYEFYKLINQELKSFDKNNAWSFSKKRTALNDEYVGSHNEYIGIGSGAFSFLGGNLYINAFELDQYASLISQRPHAIIAGSHFARREQIKYHFLTWLFNGKLDIDKFNATFETYIQKTLAQELYLLKRAHAINIKENIITNTEFGNYLALCMMKEFYSGMDKIRAMFRQNHLKLAV
ncbi:MAG TPA: coproporphyrinogen III oxidase [Sulfurospirillum sp. UBA12182]|nr:MAG TPA: coproporphyrinogen III oxidase [Sulfurospirillum sp. UBA12182]